MATVTTATNKRAAKPAAIHATTFSARWRGRVGLASEGLSGSGDKNESLTESLLGGRRLECLSDADEVLGRSYTRNRIEVVAEVDADGTDRGGVAQTDTDVVGIEGSEVMKAYRREHVAAVVEGNDAEALL